MVTRLIETHLARPFNSISSQICVCFLYRNLTLSFGALSIDIPHYTNLYKTVLLILRR